jgi:hypothetical protein
VVTLAAVLAALVTVLGIGAAPVFATSAAPGWKIDSFAEPTNFSTVDEGTCLREVGVARPLCDAYRVIATNAGSAAGDGSTITLADTLPAGVTLRAVQLYWTGLPELNLAPVLCTEAPLQCKFSTAEFGLPPFGPDERLTMNIYVTVDASAPKDLENVASVSGGGAPEVSTSSENPVSDARPPFDVAGFDFYASGLNGAREMQAGAHPYEAITTITLNNVIGGPKGTQNLVSSPESIKDVVVDLPLGFIGSTLAAPQCTSSQLIGKGCPADTVVGHLVTEPTGNASVNSPIYNMVPERGVAAEFGYFDALETSHVFYARVVPSPSGYVLQVTSADIPAIELTHIIATFYGEPAERDGTGNAAVPFFTNPAICDGSSPTASIYIDSWSNPGRENPDGTPDLRDSNWRVATSQAPPVTGCDSLRFGPELKAQPTTEQADAPSGLNFELRLPQPENDGTLATPPLKKATVTLPPGLTIDPSAGDGLQACSIAQIGWVGPKPMSFDTEQPRCPEASKIGALALTSPLIPGTLTGAMYLAAPDENPFGSLLAAYVVVDDPVTGVLIKLAGQVQTNPETGQITATFDENPQLPFSDLKLNFFGGPRAEFATPESCGTFTTTAALVPWSAPDSGPAASPFDSFPIEYGCVDAFAPSFTAGSTNLQAGAYTQFVASFSRGDADQELAGLSVSLPPGLLANVGSVPLCPDADANAGTCPESSRVGSVDAGAGPGPNPLFVPGGAYLTGPYKGAPYGLVVEVPAIAGPLNLGVVHVRQALYIDPRDAHVTDVSDPFPTMLQYQGQGIPIRLRRVDVRLDRPGFTFNPTNCSKLEIAGTLRSTGGATAATQTQFQVTNCATLAFKPKLAVTIGAHVSHVNGDSATFKLSYPAGSQGSEANIGRFKVELPKRLPARLGTLQKACPEDVFATDPASCPAAATVGHAIVHTPVLPVPLSGPAVFVSHGGAKFPELVIVLQGDNVTIDVHVETFISKQGITSGIVKAVPDTPFSTFELTLPAGPDSEFTALGNPCKGTLQVPTELAAQNGANIHTKTKIAVKDCPKSKHKQTKRKRAKAKGVRGHGAGKRGRSVKPASRGPR